MTQVVISDSDAAELLPYGCTATMTSLKIPSDISRDDWMDLFNTLQALEARKRSELRTIKFWIGDCLRFGEGKWGEDCAQAVLQEAGYADQTCANMAWVAGKIPPSRRRENPKVTFEHHVEVAPLEARDQDRWLDEVEEKELPVKTLRREIRHEKDLQSGKDPRVGDASRALALAREAVMAAPIESWSGVLIEHLIVPIGSDRPRVEYEAFLAVFGAGIAKLRSPDA